MIAIQVSLNFDPVKEILKVQWKRSEENTCHN